MDKWIPVWHYVPIDYNQEIGVFENITQKALFTNNLRGRGLKIRFNNLYNDQPMVIRHAAVGLCNRVTGRRTAPVAVTLQGSEEIFLAPNSQPYSDVLALDITPEDDILLLFYFEKKTSLRSVCTTSTWQSWQSSHHTGNFHETDALGFTIKAQLAPALAADPTPNQFAAGVSEVLVHTSDDVQLVGLFGDSITHMSYFSDCLLAELYKRWPGKYAVINAGIAGNRIQKDFPAAKDFPGGGNQFGIAGKDRFLRDLYDGIRPDIVFIMEGVNDCSHSLVFSEPDVPCALDIFHALTQVADQAHSQRSKVIISTIPPFGAFGEAWREQAEALRGEYNQLIRTSFIADKVVDLDALLRDPDDPHRMQESMHLGDGVHPNWKGGAKMAAAVLEQCFSQ